MEDAVARLEDDMRDVKSVLSRLEPMIIRIDAVLQATLPHLATRAELSATRSDINAEVSGLRVEMNLRSSDTNQKLAELPTRTYVWGILVGLIAAYGAGVAALAVLK